MQDEYVTRHKLDGTIIYADHRIGTVTGHLPHEVVGVSAHKYMEPSDVVIALFAQKQSEFWRWKILNIWTWIHWKIYWQEGKLNLKTLLLSVLASHSGKGVVVYRLRTRGDEFIYLRTSGYLHYDQSTMQVKDAPIHRILSSMKGLSSHVNINTNINMRWILKWSSSITWTEIW